MQMYLPHIGQWDRYLEVECFVKVWLNVLVEDISLPASASKNSIRRFVIAEKAPTRAFSWLKADIQLSAFTFKKQAHMTLQHGPLIVS